MKTKRTTCVVIGFLLLGPGLLPVGAEQSPASEYAHRLFNPASGVRSAVAAGIDQAAGTPSEWGGGIKGFGRRLGSAFGTHIIRSTIHFGVSKMLHEELDYHRSEKQGFRPRFTYALVATVVTRKTTTQKQTVAVGEISGILGGGLISRLWHPVRFHTVGSGLSSAGIGFAAEAGMNVMREFWPEIRHPRRGRANPPQKPASTPAAFFPATCE
jgi:hypothetical protein